MSRPENKNFTDITNKLIVILLCAGEGRRMKDMTSKIPKPLLTVPSLNDKHIIEINLERLKKTGIKNIIIVVGHLGNLINDYIKDNYRAQFPDMGDKEDENANEIADYTDKLSVEYSLEKTLRDINNALDKIKKGKYGKCKYCGKEIPEKRLLARPASSACIDCKDSLTSQ